MFGAFERMVAVRYLRARRREGFISVIAWFSLIGIALGVATLIIVMSVMNGFRAELFQRILGLNGHISVLAPGRTIEDYDALIARLMEIPGVAAAAPLVEGQGLIIVDGRASGVVLRGLRPDDVRARPILADNVIEGDVATFGEDATGLLVGRRLAQRFGLRLGSVVTLVSPTVAETGFGIMPRLKRFRVAGLFDVGMYEYDNGFLFMPLEMAQPFLQLRGAVTSIDVIIDDPRDLAPVRDLIRVTLGTEYLVRDWQTINASFFNALKVERNVMFLILTLIILVAAFNIISSLIMLVKDKGKDIAILRTMGASRGMIMRIFLLSGASVGVFGTAVGTGLGLAFALNIEDVRRFLEIALRTELFAAEIYFLTQLPSVVYASDVVSVVLMAIALSFLATLYPSWRAARIDPVEALRYE